MRHLRGVAAAALFSVATISSAGALDATGTFRGAILVTAVTSQCNMPGYPVVGQTLLTVFRPNAPSTPPAALLVTFSNGSLLVTPVGSPPPVSGSYVGELMAGVATYTHYTGGTYNI